VKKGSGGGMNDALRSKHEQAVSKELNRVQERFGDQAAEKKPFGSIKLPSFQELEEKKKTTPTMKAKKIIDSEGSDDDKWTD
jgi:hypothetical protein